MSQVRIVTDSTSCLPSRLTEEYGIRVVPLGLIVNGKPCRDQVDITPSEFYRILPTLPELPSTSAVTPGDFVNVFSDLAQDGSDVVCILLSSALSATIEAAREARQTLQAEHPGLNIEIVDSRTSAGALGLIVLAAARASQAGKSLPEIMELIEAMIPRVKYIGALDTLRYLIKGGRAPKTAYIGELLQVKPIIGLVGNEGLVDTLGKARTRKKAFEKVLDLTAEQVGNGKNVHAIVHYSHRPEDGDLLRGMLESRFNCTETLVTELTPVMSCHTGPVAGVSFYWED